MMLGSKGILPPTDAYAQAHFYLLTLASFHLIWNRNENVSKETEKRQTSLSERLSEEFNDLNEPFVKPVYNVYIHRLKKMKSITGLQPDSPLRCTQPFHDMPLPEYARTAPYKRRSGRLPLHNHVRIPPLRKRQKATP